jgi:MFS family permease
LGSVAGIVLAGTQSRPATQRLGLLLPTACALMGAGMLTVGFAASIVPAALAALAMGGGLGYTIVVMTTWLQQRTPEYLMGRTMSLLMLAVVGVIPVSMMLVGVTLAFSTQATFVGAGGLILLVAVWAFSTPALYQLGSQPPLAAVARPFRWSVRTARSLRARADQWADAQHTRLHAAAGSGAERSGNLNGGQRQLNARTLTSGLTRLAVQVCRLAPARRQMIERAKSQRGARHATLRGVACAGWRSVCEHLALQRAGREAGENTTPREDTERPTARE